MSNDDGIYILITPAKQQEKKEEFRVARLERVPGGQNITWTLGSGVPSEALDPTKVKFQFDKSRVFTCKGDALEEAARLAEEMEEEYDYTPMPVFHVYVSTEYSLWV